MLKRKEKNISLIIHATTLCTNALLTRKGIARAAMITNKGFKDIIEIARQRRPELYNIFVERPSSLIERKDRFEIYCRILHNGRIEKDIDDLELQKISRKIIRSNYESVAVCFLNSYANSSHENKVKQSLVDAGYKGHISVSSEISNEYREYERFSTTVVNAVVSPLLEKYISALERKICSNGINARLLFMNSEGGANEARYMKERAVLSIESGPAAGVLASANIARKLRLKKCITFDMGGTTSKASVIENYQPSYTFEYEVAGKVHSGRISKGSGYTIRLPFIDVAEVGTGGGSIAWIDEGGELRVGPRSASSIPGPACYGRGGKEPTVTDANLVLGRLNQEYLLGGEMKLYPEKAIEVLEKLGKKIGLNAESISKEVITLANNETAGTVSIVTTERGRNPSEFTLIAFGGSGPMHCCEISEELGIKRIFVPNHAGIFSAYGLLSVDMVTAYVLPVMGKSFRLENYFKVLEDRAKKDGFNLKKATISRYVDARYVGQSYEITIPYVKGTDRKTFDEAHFKIYGFTSKDDIEVVNARIRVVIKLSKAEPPSYSYEKKKPESRYAFISGARYYAKVYNRSSLRKDEIIEGPAIIEEYDSTTVLSRGWKLTVLEYGLMIEYGG